MNKQKTIEAMAKAICAKAEGYDDSWIVYHGQAEAAYDASGIKELVAALESVAQGGDNQ